MLARRIVRAAALAAAGALLLSGTTVADTVAVDGDTVTAGVQTSVNLGTVAAGATISRDVTLTLSCDGLQHVDPGQIVTVFQAGATVPAGGGSITATSTTIGPVPAEWADDTAGIAGCTSPLQLDAATASQVTIVAPPVAGLDYTFVVQYGRSLSPEGVSDGSSVTGFTAVSFVLDVADGGADTTPPSFASDPPDLDLATADPAGVSVDYTLPSATDDVDPAPTVACDPAPGALFPIGSTTVTCTATDGAGNEAVATFTVTVHLGGVAWGEPVVASGVVAASGRSLPIKVSAWLDGAPVHGDATLVVNACEQAAPGTSTSVDATWQPDAGRWMAILDTKGFTVGCYRVQLVVDGTALGSFDLTILTLPTEPGAISRGASQPR